MRNSRSKKVIRKRKKDDSLDRLPDPCSTYNKRECSPNNPIEFPRVNSTPKRSDYNYSSYPETFTQATTYNRDYTTYNKRECSPNNPIEFPQINGTPKRSDYNYSSHPETFTQATTYNKDYKTTSIKDECVRQSPFQLHSINNHRYQIDNETLPVEGIHGPWYNYCEREYFPYKRRRFSQASGRSRRLNFSRYPQATTFNCNNFYGTPNERDMAQFPCIEDNINNYHYTTGNKIVAIPGVQESWHQPNLCMKGYLAPSDANVSETELEKDSKFFDKNLLPEYFLNLIPKSRNDSYYLSNAQIPIYGCSNIDPLGEQQINDSTNFLEETSPYRKEMCKTTNYVSQGVSNRDIIRKGTLTENKTDYEGGAFIKHFLQSPEKNNVKNEVTGKVLLPNNYFNNYTYLQNSSSSNHDCLSLNQNQKSAESISNNTILPYMKDNESAFTYSNVLNTDNFLSEFDSSLSSVTNYILDEPKYSEPLEESSGRNEYEYSPIKNKNRQGVSPQKENTTGEEKDKAAELKHVNVDDMKVTPSEFINDMFNLNLCDSISDSNDDKIIASEFINDMFNLYSCDSISDSNDDKITPNEFINEISDLFLGDVFEADTSAYEPPKSNQIIKVEEKSDSCKTDLQSGEAIEKTLTLYSTFDDVNSGFNSGNKFLQKNTTENFNTDNNGVSQIVSKHYPNKHDIAVQTEAENHLLKCNVSIQTEAENHYIKRTVSIQTEIQNHPLKRNASIQTKSKNHALKHNVSIQTETKNHPLKRDASIQIETNLLGRDFSIQTKTKNHHFKHCVSIQTQTNNHHFKNDASFLHTGSSDTKCNNFYLYSTNISKKFSKRRENLKISKRITDNVKPSETYELNSEFEPASSKYKTKFMKIHPQNKAVNYLAISKNSSINSGSKITESINFQKNSLSEKTKEFEINEANSQNFHEKVIETAKIETDISTLSIKKFKNQINQKGQKQDASVNKKLCIPHTPEAPKINRTKVTKIGHKNKRRSQRLKKL